MQNSRNPQNGRPQLGVCPSKSARTRLRGAARVTYEIRAKTRFLALDRPLQHRWPWRSRKKVSALCSLVACKTLCSVLQRWGNLSREAQKVRFCVAKSPVATRDMQPSTSCKAARTINCTKCNLQRWCSLTIAPLSGAKKVLQLTRCSPVQKTTLATALGYGRQIAPPTITGCPLPQSILPFCVPEYKLNLKKMKV